VKYACLYGTSDLSSGCGRPLTTHSRIAYQVSTGACTVASPDIVITNNDISSLTTAKTWCDGNNIACTINAGDSNEDWNVKVGYTNLDGVYVEKFSNKSFQDLVKPGTSVNVTYNPGKTGTAGGAQTPNGSGTSGSGTGSTESPATSESPKS
jgi:hypothetical protein